MTTSILIPCFNSAEYIEQTLKSAIRNMSDCDELVVVDDHSEDDSIQIAEVVLNEANVTYQVTSNPGKGACAARNHAFNISRGQLIQWLDADDLISPSKISIQKTYLAKHSESLVVSPFRPFIGNHETGLIHDDRSWELPLEQSPADWIAADQMTIPACWLGTRDLFEKAGPWDTELKVNQDGEYFVRVIAAAQCIVFAPHTEVFYRRGIKNSVSHFSPEKAPSLFRSIKSIQETSMKLEDSFRMKQMISNKYQHAIFTVFPHHTEGILWAQEQLKSLPKPTISNPIAVSRFSKIIAGIFGWKTLKFLRIWRNQLMTWKG